MQPTLVIVDENRSGDVHRVHQHKPLNDSTLSQACLHLRSDIDERPSPRHIEPQFLTITLHPQLRTPKAFAKYSPRLERSDNPGIRYVLGKQPCKGSPVA